MGSSTQEELLAFDRRRVLSVLSEEGKRGSTAVGLVFAGGRVWLQHPQSSTKQDSETRGQHTKVRVRKKEADGPSLRQPC